MKYRDFGSTGLRVSEIVVGGGAVGGLFIDADEATKERALRTALDAGVNWIDTAPMYGDGRSEESFGALLPGLDPAPHVSTKVFLDPAAGDVAGQVRASFENSLARLRRQSVDVFFLHNPIKAQADDEALGIDAVLGAGGVADAMETIRGQGLARFLGFTALGETEACLEAAASGRFDAAQVYYNMINPSAAWPRNDVSRRLGGGQDFANLIETCATHSIAVMAIRVFAAGILASDIRHGREGPPMTEDAAIADEEARAAAAFSVLDGDAYGTRAQTALRYALSCPDMSCVVVGMAELDHLEQALAAQRRGGLPDEALARLEARFGV